MRCGRADDTGDPAHASPGSEQSVIDRHQSLPQNRPRIPLLHERTCPCSDIGAQGRALQEGDNPICKGLGLIGQQEVLAIHHLKALGSHRRGDDGPPERHGLQDLEAGSAARPQGDHAYRAGGIVWLHVGHASRDDDV